MGVRLHTMLCKFTVVLLICIPTNDHPSFPNCFGVCSPHNPITITHVIPSDRTKRLRSGGGPESKPDNTRLPCCFWEQGRQLADPPCVWVLCFFRRGGVCMHLTCQLQPPSNEKVCMWAITMEICRKVSEPYDCRITTTHTQQTRNQL